MGILVLGAPPPSIALRLNSSLIIPPSLPTYDYLNYCPASCTTKHIAITETEEVEGGKEGMKEGGVMTPHILYAYVHMHLMATQGEIQLLRNTSSVTVATAAAAVAAGGVGADAATAKEGGGKGGRLERFEMLYRRRWDARNQEGMTFPAPGFALQSDDAFLVSFLKSIFWVAPFRSFFVLPFLPILHIPSSLPPSDPYPYALADPLPLRLERETNRNVLWPRHNGRDVLGHHAVLPCPEAPEHFLGLHGFGR